MNTKRLRSGISLLLAHTCLLASCGGGGGGGGGGGSAGATIALSSSSLQFSAVADGADPAPQTVQVTSGGQEPLNGLSASISYSGPSTGWLSADFRGTTTPANLSVRAASRSLGRGDHRATITIRSANASEVAAIAVSLGVAPPSSPVIGLSQSSLSFLWSSGDPPAIQSVDVTNSGAGMLSQLQSVVTYGSGQPGDWLSATLDRTSAPAELSVAVFPGRLPNATYTATIVVSSPVASSSRSVAVSFTMDRGPTLVLSNVSLAFASQGTSGAPAAQTVQVTNAGDGSLSGLAASVSHDAGQPRDWLAAELSRNVAPATLTLRVSPGSIEAGTYRAAVRVSSTAAANEEQVVTVSWTHTLPTGPTLNPPVVDRTQIRLSWTFAWPPNLATSNDQYWLEESTTSPFSGFALIAVFPQASTHSPSFTAPPLTRSTAGTYWYRVRAYTWQGWTAFSAVQSANVSTVAAARFQNNAVWSIVSLKVDGVEQFTTQFSGIPTGVYYQIPLAPGAHRYEAFSGTWNSDGSRFPMYGYSGTFSQPAGSILTVPFENPSISDLLTRFSSTGRWSGYYWLNLVPHSRTFQFKSDGSFTLYDDGFRIGSGTYQIVRYTRGLITFRVRYTTGETFESQLNEFNSSFIMRNGVPGWSLIEYVYKGR